MTITSKATKAQILEAYAESQAKLKALEANGADWPAVRTWTINTIRRATVEFAALVRDTYRAGALTRQWVSAVITDLSQPVLKSKP